MTNSRYPELTRALIQAGLTLNDVNQLTSLSKPVELSQGSQIEIPNGEFPPYLVASGQLISDSTNIIFKPGDVLTPLINEFNIASLTVDSSTAILLAYTDINAASYLKQISQKTYQSVAAQFTPNKSNETGQLIIKSNGKANAKQPIAKQLKMSVIGYLQLLFADGFFTSQMFMTALLIQLFMLALPVFYMTIFNHVFGHQNLNTLNVMAVGMLIVLVLDTLCKHGRGFVMANQLEFIDKISLQTVLQKLVKLPPLEQVKQISQAGFSSIVAELARNNQVMATYLLISFLDGIFGLLLMGFLLFLHPILAAVSISSLIPIALISILITPKIQKSQLTSNQGQQKLQLKVNEMLQQAEGLKAANASAIAADRVTELGYQSYENQGISRFSRIQGMPIQGLFINAASILTLYLGAHEVLEGRMSYGVYMAINMLSRTVLTTMQQFIQSIMQFREASASVDALANAIENIDNLHTKKSASRNTSVIQYFTPSDIHGHLGLQAVSFTYPEQPNPVFENADLRIAAGEKVVITGANGSGKTTLLRLLSGIVHPINGQVTLDGMSLEEVLPEKISEFIGGVFHRPAIISDTIKQNLLLSSPNATMQQVSQAVDFVGLNPIISKMPKGLETELASFGANLSTGIVARLGLARLIIHNPQILLIDEVINSIDPLSARQIIQSLINIYPEKTMVIVSPDPAIHQMVDRVLFIQDAKIKTVDKTSTPQQTLVSNRTK